MSQSKTPIVVPFETDAVSHAGGRDSNQDRHGHFLQKDGRSGCWVVADGLGGHRGGEIASRLAVDAILRKYREYCVFDRDTIEKGLQAAHLAIRKKVEENSALFGMRTTVVVLLIDGDQALWAHIGDSRLYHFRQSKQIFCTKDHSVTRALHDAGEIVTQQIRTDENRSRLTRVLGKDESVEPTFGGPTQLQPEDSFLLCSDGFWEFVEDEEMANDLSKSRKISPEQWLNTMVSRIRKKAGAAPNHDNYTGMAVFCPAELTPSKVRVAPAAQTTQRPKKAPPRPKKASPGKKSAKPILAVLGALVALTLVFFVLRYFGVIPSGQPKEGPNQPPVAVDDLDFKTEQGVPVEIAVLANDQDADGDELVLGSVGIPEHGEAVWNDQGILTYTPEEGYVGGDQFTYEVSDGRATAEGTVEILVQAPADSEVNHPPVARDDKETIAPGEEVAIRVLANDRDPDRGDTVELVEVGDAVNGQVEWTQDGTVVYTPDEGFTGLERIPYRVTDGEDESEGVIEILVEDLPPLAVADSATSKDGQPVTLDVLANDQDPEGKALSVQSVDVDSNVGSATVNADSTITFTPAEAASGTIELTYVVSDGRETATGKVTIEITRTTVTNRAPTAVADQRSTTRDTQIGIRVLENDKDPDGDELELLSVGDPQGGTAKVEGEQVFYKPNAGFVGGDEFTYRISDGKLEANGKIEITITKTEPQAGETRRNHGMENVWIPGSASSSLEGFWIGTTEVTVADYKTFLRSNKPDKDLDGLGDDNDPIVDVTWTEAKQFCEFVDGRLPRESEWQHAAQAGRADARYPWAEGEPTCNEREAQGVNYGACDREETLPVRSFGKNEFGLYDVMGNVWEWCQGTDADQPVVILGGSFKTKAVDLDLRKVKRRKSARSINANRKFPDVGFRCVWDRDQ